MKVMSRKVKVKPIAIATVIIVLAIAGHALLIARFFQGQSDYDSIIEEVESVHLTIGRFKDLDELQADQAAAESKLNEARLTIPTTRSNTSAIQSLLQLAQSTNLEIIDVKSQAEDNEVFGEHTYGSMSVRLSVRGTLGELMLFLENIEKGAIKAARVDDLGIVELSQTPSEESNAYESENTSLYDQITLAADLRISIFIRL